MPELTPEQRRLRARIGGYSRASMYDGRQMTAKARAASLDRFERQVDPDASLPEAERKRRADVARREWFRALAVRSAASRRKLRRDPAEMADLVRSELRLLSLSEQQPPE